MLENILFSKKICTRDLILAILLFSISFIAKGQPCEAEMRESVEVNCRLHGNKRTICSPDGSHYNSLRDSLKTPFDPGQVDNRENHVRDREKRLERAIQSNDQGMVADAKADLCAARVGLEKAKEADSRQVVNNSANASSIGISKQQQRTAIEIQGKSEVIVKKVGKRTHYPEMEANTCISLHGNQLYGGFINRCPYKVVYTFCVLNPKSGTGAAFQNCEQQNFGTDIAGPASISVAHTKGGSQVYWLACKEPAWPLDQEFIQGQGIEGRCRPL